MSEPPLTVKEEDVKEEPVEVPILPVSPTKSKPPVSKPTKKEKSPSTPSAATTQGPQLVGDLPRAEEESFKTFENLEGNIYQYGTLGRANAIEESYLCDCQYEHGRSTLLLSFAPPALCGSL